MQVPVNLIASPLNYTGGKYKLLPQLLPLFPNEVNTFVDLFCGGCNVAVNANAKKYSKKGIPDMKAYEIGYVSHTDKVIKGEFKGNKEMTQFVD